MSQRSLKSRGAAIRRSVSALISGPRRRYPPALLGRIEAYARTRCAQGVSKAQICREVGISSPTLVRLLSAEAGTLRRVRVAGDTVAEREPASASLTVRGPGGIVVEGLDVAGVAALMRELA